MADESVSQSEVAREKCSICQMRRGHTGRKQGDGFDYSPNFQRSRGQSDRFGTRRRTHSLPMQRYKKLSEHAENVICLKRISALPCVGIEERLRDGFT
jgi:hypothetical protein